MDRPRLLLCLLLVFCLCEASPPDFQTLLTELRDELTKLQRENIDNVALYESRLGRLEADNRDHVGEIQKLKTESRDLLTLIERLETENKGHAAELSSLKSRASVAENQVDVLTRNQQARRVAFSVAVDGDNEWIGPFETDSTLIYKKVISNIGNAYSSTTGIFRAPVRGVYHFEFHLHTKDGHNIGAHLMKNGAYVVSAYDTQNAEERETTGNSATLLLEEGDLVNVRMWSGSRIWVYGNRKNTFSGRLLFLM